MRILLVAAAAPALWAQSTFGTFLGRVTDPSGQAINGARVSLTLQEENLTRAVLTGSDGGYEAANLKPGAYTLSISYPGFEAFQARGAVLAARQTVRIDAQLKVGTQSETVDVTAQAGVIQTDTGAVTSALGNERVINLPVNHRAAVDNSSFQLIATMPGVQSNNSAAGQASFSINGALPGQASYSVDGVSVQHPRGGGAMADTFPSAEAIAELKVQGAGNTAEFAGVGDVTAVTRSGGNAFHGAGFWYFQNDALDSQRFGTATKEQKQVNLAGFNFSGPVWIPKLYNGRNRTFFYADFEGRNYPRTSLVQNDVPTSSMRGGDFSKETGVTLLDPTTGKPFAGNKIPTSRISSISQAFLQQFYPTPNTGSADVFHTTNYVTNKQSDIPGNLWDLRLDQVINSKQTIFGRYTRRNVNTISAADLLIPGIANSPQNTSFVASHNYSIKPNLLNEFRFGWSDNVNASNFVDGFDGRKFTQGLGFNGLPVLPFNGLPEINIDNITGIGVDRVQGADTYRTLTANENLTWVIGRHSIKGGLSLFYNRSKTALGFYGADNFGTYSFTDGVFTGNGFANFLLGLPSGSAVATVLEDNDGRSSEYHAYLQDSFRVSRKLTLEYGIRWQYLPPFQDESGNIGNFDRSIPKTGAILYPSSQKAATLLAPGLLLAVNACAGTPNLPANNLGGIPGVGCTPFKTAKEAGLPEGLRKDYKYNFYPRFGFAYRPFDDANTVVRGGFGLYNMPIRGAVFYSLTGTAQTDVRSYINVDGQGNPIFSWPNIKTSGSGVSVSAADYGTNYFGTANVVDFKNPYVTQWSLTVERNIGYNTGVRVSYIGLKGTHLPFAPNVNQSYYSTTPYSQQPLTSRPFPYWYRIESRDQGGNSAYNSAQIEVNRRFSHGLSFTAAYTLAHNVNDIGGPNPTDFGSETGNGRIMDSLNRAGSRGNDYATRRHRFVSTAVYEIPFGRGKRFGSKLSRTADMFAGGWQLSGIFIGQSGPFMTPSQGGTSDPSGTGSGYYRTQRPDRLASGVPSNQTIAAWVDRNAFVCAGQESMSSKFSCSIGSGGSSPAPIGRFGNSGVGILEGPGGATLSMGFGKYFQATEKFRVGVQGTFTNILDRTNYDIPNLSISSSGFGAITKATVADFGGNRTGQIAVRLEF
ncbi:MAG: carboxypeptidase regulatory-like domain-containing protein [Acidobacteria bacterium]|nr:carboxypeptidase regulatory-like domain-containing protein [Acidobacteriota bacterium]